jgi:hypothetical protein
MGRKARGVLAAAAVVVAATVGTGLAEASPAWAPAATARVHPGVVVDIAGIKCVAGYVMQSPHRLFLALPASCGGADVGTQVNACYPHGGSTAPIGLKVTVQGARYDGTLVYNSWEHMQRTGESRPARCNHNNIELIRLDRRDNDRVNPSIPLLGGPAGVSRAAPTAPATLMVYLAGATATATAVQTNGAGWNHTMVVNSAVPLTAVGSPVLTKVGKALGMVTVAPPQGTAGQTSVSDLYRELRALRNVRGFHHVHLAKGTVGFTAS